MVNSDAATVDASPVANVRLILTRHDHDHGIVKRRAGPLWEISATISVAGGGKFSADAQYCPQQLRMLSVVTNDGARKTHVADEWAA